MAELTDRELLERAAKAAGLTIKDSNRWADTVIREVSLDDGSTNWVRWNPLTDDGDCARLEATREIDIDWGILKVKCTDGEGWIGVAFYVDHGGDKQKARRYASTTAASLATEGGV